MSPKDPHARWHLVESFGGGVVGSLLGRETVFQARRRSNRFPTWWKATNETAAQRAEAGVSSGPVKEMPADARIRVGASCALAGSIVATLPDVATIRGARTPLNVQH